MMPKQRGPRNLKISDDTTDGAAVDEEFEEAFAIIDACFMGALISGASLECVKPALSYAFLQVASERRGVTGEAQNRWLDEPNFVWQPVFEAVLSDLENFGQFFDAEEVESEMSFLRDECKISAGSLSEFEERRHSKIAHLLLQQCLETLSHRLIDARDVELAFFIEWLKVSTICGEIAYRDYSVVRSNPADVESCYGRAIDKITSK